ncbi:hypothetical protein GF345_04940 [Candidatus Woesearchaeota archaeon]|nr:hypothetical protein [Candidatus Woesearchaeota archaeon]
MGRRGDLAYIICLVLILAPCAFAWESEVSSNVYSIYETNSADFVVNVDNPQENNESINTVSIEASGFSINSAEESSGWRNMIQGMDIMWDIFIPFGDQFDWIENLPFIDLGISSDANQNFRFNAYAHKVDDDTTYNWPVSSEFHDDTDDTEVLTITVLNDYTGPVLSNWTPEDGDFVKQGTEDLPASINATDPETGVKQVFFNYIDCAEAGNSSQKVSINLTHDRDIWSDMTDVSQYDDSTEVCFTFFAENNGGARSNVSGAFMIDGIAPEITLVAPEDNARMNSQSDFEFIADDNLAETMECELLVDSQAEVQVTAIDEQVTTVPVTNVSEGQHEWAVRCTDLAGWETTSEARTYILDRTPPEIVMDSPESPIIAENTDLEFTATDNFELDAVGYVDQAWNIIVIDKSTYASINESHFTISTSGWSEGYHEVWVGANDTAGNNVTQRHDIIIDKTAPVVNLISPANQSESTTPTPFTFDADDDYDTMIDCTLYVDDADTGTTVVNTSQNTTSFIEGDMIPGDYYWRVECEDDAGNMGISETWLVTIIDITGPEITIHDPGMTVRGNAVNLNITLWDISGIDDSSIAVEVTDPNGIVIPMTVTEQDGYYTGSLITTVNSAIGEWDISVYAEDTAGNGNTQTGVFDVTYGYEVTINADPSSALTTDTVNVSGSVRFDNGSTVPEEFVTLVLPGNTIQTALDASTGAYTISDNFPAGSHDLIATITAGNGFTFNATTGISISNPSSGGETEGGGDDDDDDDDDDGGSSGFQCPVNECYEDGECVQCSESDDGIESKIEVSNEGTPPSDGSSGLVYYCGDADCDYSEDCENCPEDCGECEDESLPATGKATGFFSFEKISSNLFWWVLLMLLSIMFMLAYMKRKGPPGFSRDDTLGLDDYLERMNRNQ